MHMRMSTHPLETAHSEGRHAPTFSLPSERSGGSALPSPTYPLQRYSLSASATTRPIGPLPLNDSCTRSPSVRPATSRRLAINARFSAALAVGANWCSCAVCAASLVVTATVTTSSPLREMVRRTASSPADATQE